MGFLQLTVSPFIFKMLFATHAQQNVVTKYCVWLFNILVDQQGIVVCDSHSYNILHESIQRNPTPAAVFGNNGNYYFILSEHKVKTILF